MRRGTLILPFWDYVAGLLGQKGRYKSHSHSPKLKLRSQLLSTTTWKLEKTSMLRSFSCLRPRSNARGKRNSLQIILNVDYCLIHPKIFCCFKHVNWKPKREESFSQFSAWIHKSGGRCGVYWSTNNYVRYVRISYVSASNITWSFESIEIETWSPSPYLPCFPFIALR